MMKRNFNKKEHQDWRSDLIERDKGCIICGHGLKGLNAHHLIPANFKEFEFDIDNGVMLCPSHHTLGKFSAHKHPIWFSRWLRINRNPQYALAIRRIREEEGLPPHIEGKLDDKPMEDIVW